jgi:hypothetical protein
MTTPFPYNDDSTAFVQFCGDPSDPECQTRVIVRQPALVINQSEIPIQEVAETSITASYAETASLALSASNAQFAVSASYLTQEILFGDLANVWYVTQEGSDTNDGKTLGTAFRTIKKGMQEAEQYISGSVGFPRPRCTVLVSSGYYEEVAPIVVPPFTSVVGNDLRTSVVRPTFATRKENLFLMNNGTYAYGLRLEGCEIDDLTNPRSGFYFAFDPGASVVTSPYIQNCTAAHTPADKFYVPLDYQGTPQPNPEVGNGPGGMIVDDSVLDPYSPLKSMIVDAYTQVAFNGMGLVVRGEGYAQQVSFFTNFSHVGVWAIDGGHASLLNSNTTFGDYGLRSSGKRILVIADVEGISTASDSAASSIILAEKNNILNNMMSRLQISGSFTSSYLDTGSAIYQSTMKDGGILIDSIASDLLGAPGRTVNFTQALFKGQDISSGSIYTLPTASGFDQGAIAVFRVNDIFRYNEVSCSRDIGYIVDALTTDMLYGGNQRSVMSGEFYYKFPSVATTTQLQKTLDGIRYAGELAISFTTSSAQSSSIASNLATILDIVENGTGSLPPIVLNSANNIKVISSTQITSSSAATGTELTKIDSLTTSLIDIITNGTGSLPALSENTFENIKFTDEPQFISGSTTGSNSDVTFVSSSIALVSSIVLNGTGSLPTLIPYTTPSTNPNTLAAYNLLTGNLEFIKKETIAYISSSWSTASYDQDKCERDIGYIVSGAAEDLLYSSNSASLASGIAYYEIPSQATGQQLNFTLDAIKYVNRLSQKVIQNITFSKASVERKATWDLLRDNRTMLQNEVVAYISSSWSEASYNENLCKRDVGYIIDAISTDIYYGGNERTIEAGRYYYLYPSQATGAQLIFTTDAIEYLSGIMKPIVSNTVLSLPTTENFTTYTTIRNNRTFIRERTIDFINDALVFDFLRSWKYVKEYIINDPDGRFGAISFASKTKISQLIDVPITTIRSVVVDLEPTYLQVFGSLITSTSHDFSYAGSGVNFLGLPANQRGIGKTNFVIRVFEEGGGRVYHTSGDETGDFFAGNDFIIRQATGTIDGRTFNKALLARVTPLQLALENL